MPRPLITALLALLAAIGIAIDCEAAGAPARAAPTQAHRDSLRDFTSLLESDPKRALAVARAAIDAAKRGVNERRLADALEMLALAQMKLENYADALPPATDLVRIRQTAQPVDHELVALALGMQATVLFALDRSSEADDTLWQQLREWRLAFPKDDIRLAQKLEQHAELVQQGFGRTRVAMELLEEAAAIRDRHPDSSRGRFAQTLQDLALLQMRQAEYTKADANLARAVRLIDVDIARDPAREENKAGRAQMLVLRAGIAGSLGDIKRAAELAAAARGIAFKDRVLAAENRILVAASQSVVLELNGDVEGAIAEQRNVLAVFRDNDDLVAAGALDKLGIADTHAWLVSLYFRIGDLAAARDSLAYARRELGDNGDVLFKLSELERRSGHADAALRFYRQALRARKESASEVSVFFGTARAPTPGSEPGAFGVEPADTVSLGDAVVFVPGGTFSADSWLASKVPVPIPVGSATDPLRLVIREKSVLAAAAVRERSRAQLNRARLYPDSALVFVHGFNVTFDQALQRVAQLVRDLNYDGPAFVFSWASKGSMFRYGTDRTTADRTAKELAGFLDTVARSTGAKRVHVIAHSMGNRLLLPALADVVRDPRNAAHERIGEVVMAAPAVPQGEYSQWIDELARADIGGMTLYASNVDNAMRAGFLREGFTVLAGFVADGEPLTHAKLASIDLTEAGVPGLTNLNHDVFASNPVMTEDMRALLQNGERDPAKRIPTLRLRKSAKSGLAYWYYAIDAAHR